MAAIFSDLHDVAQVLSEHIREETGIFDVQPGVPRDVTSTTEAAARITLLYTTPQQVHRNDPIEAQPDGTQRPPPLALSCFYLLTTSGADADDPIAAHHALGRIMTLYHDNPALELPLSDNPGADPGAFTELGEGVMAVVQVPMTLDQIDKIWTSLDVQLQPWALFEVSPVQLVSQLEDTGPPPVVRPGGFGVDMGAGTRPMIARVTPAVVRRGGRVRIDLARPVALSSVSAGGVEVPVGDASVEVAPGDAGLSLTLDDGGLEDLAAGAHPLTVRTADLISRGSVLRIAEGTAPTIDAPATPHDPTDDLVLTGANLSDAQDAVLWPDVGVAAPSDVHDLPVTGVANGSVMIPAAGGLSTVPAAHGVWRLAIRIGAHTYTPYVLVELES